MVFEVLTAIPGLVLAILEANGCGSDGFVRPTKMLELWSMASRQVLFVARGEAGAAGCSQIDTEHLLLGLVTVDPASVSKTGAVVTIDEIKAYAQRWHANEAAVPTSVDMAMTDEAKRVMEEAATEAMASGCKVVRTEHLLFLLIKETGCHAAIVLQEKGGSLDSARAAMMAVAGSVDQAGTNLNALPFL
jgi:ATP-dependent Clp protease ATP-binding subunit ClpA